MLRRVAGLLVVALVGLSVPAPPAAATGTVSESNACAGVGPAYSGAPLVYPGLGQPRNSVAFGFGVFVGCVGRQFVVTGVASGNCGLMSGAGVANDGRPVYFYGIGNLLIVSGGWNGVFRLEADIALGENCVTGADRFLIAGSAAAV